ncbi:MAG: hypothetical protein VYA84_00585 [Planctomycetota bacterium]|nr:hypothetical protein [Planctomycetota bacterium]
MREKWESGQLIRGRSSRPLTTPAAILEDAKESIAVLTCHRAKLKASESQDPPNQTSDGISAYNGSALNV